MRFLARVVGEGHDPGLTFDVRKDGPVATPAYAAQGGATVAQQSLAELRMGSRRWRKVVALHREQQPGRAGMLWIAGHGRILGAVRRVCLPLLAVAIDDDRTMPRDPYEPTAVADALGLDPGLLAAAAYATPDPGRITPSLLARMPRLSAVVEALRRAGVSIAQVAVEDPTGVAGQDQLWLCHHTSVYIDLAPLGPPSARRLRDWTQHDLGATALQAMYAATDTDTDTETDPGADPPGPDQPRSPLPLTDAQREVVLTARTSPVSVVSGAPGTGKSHVAVAVALDTVARGGSVLLATRSGHAADVLAALLDRHPGPAPVRIGGGTTRRELADRLAGGLPARASRAEREAAVAAEEEAAARVRAAHEDLARLLAIADTDDRVDPTREVLLRTEVPGAFTVPYARVGELLGDATPRDDDGWIRRWMRSRAGKRLRDLLGAGPDTDLDRIRAAVELGRRRRLAAAIEDAGGMDLAPVRRDLDDGRTALRAAVGHRLDVETMGAPDRDGRRAVAGLAAALRAGPSRRSELLARLDAAALTDALPLWVGTVSEVEQLLPQAPGMFDVVVLDEASQLDQVVTAPVLARSRRAVVTGDPRQLRHVSFVADAEVDRALAASALEGLADRLDVRRVSTFDAAAAVAPVRWLDEHLRSVPHLIQFSAERFYDQHLHVVTTHPSVATHDAIDTLHVSGSTQDDVVGAEVEAVMDELRRLAGLDTPGTVGVVTPFRAQADALEEAVLAVFDLDVIEHLGLRVGTVHGFQGGERDTVIVSLGLAEGDPPQRRAFAEDPHLVNVMVTRARRRLLVVTALPSGTGGLLGDYLDHAERPPPPPQPREPDDAWTRSLLGELRRNGYRAGPGSDRRHGVDLVVGGGTEVVGLLTRPHPDGVDADVARHTALVRAGWDLVEVYATPADEDPVARVLDLRDRLPT